MPKTESELVLEAIDKKLKGSPKPIFKLFEEAKMRDLVGKDYAFIYPS